MQKRKTGKFATIGPAEIPKPEPNNFLHAHVAFNVRKFEKPTERHHDCPERKPPLPDIQNYKQSVILEKNDIISQNKISALMLKTEKPHPFIVDARNGHKYNLVGSGLSKFYVYKDVSLNKIIINAQDFGKVPDYIKKLRKERFENDQIYAHYLQEVSMHQQKPRLTDEERENLLANLKERHTKLYKDYLCLSVIIDTLHKKQRKAYLEQELTDIEKDIRTVEENPVIFIEN